MASIGLVLSGGMAKGAYQVGVLKALTEFAANVNGNGNNNNKNQIYISASSVGSLNAYAYSVNKLHIAEKMWLDLNLDGIRSMFKIFARTPYIYTAIDSLTDGSNSIENHFYISCLNITNITKAKLSYINLYEAERHKIKEYLKASIALPVFSKAVEISNAKYFDGALIDNIPIFPLMKHHLDYIIVVYFDSNSYTFENEYFDNKLIKINFLDDKFTKNTFSFDKKSISKMITAGYERSSTIFDMIFKNGTDDLDYIYEKICFLNMLKKGKELRITGDIVLNNINKFLKKFVPK
jgi:predicted acylesterase/phospholipase RssA